MKKSKSTKLAERLILFLIITFVFIAASTVIYAKYIKLQAYININAMNVGGKVR